MCKCEKMIEVCGKTSDMCHVTYPDGKESNDYVPSNIGIGGGDYIQFRYCVDCGKIEGKFPLKQIKR